MVQRSIIRHLYVRTSSCFFLRKKFSDRLWTYKMFFYVLDSEQIFAKISTFAFLS
jgi:hypothetical protein